MGNNFISKQTQKIKMVDSRKFIIGGNWKSNGSVDFVRQQCTEVLNGIKFD